METMAGDSENGRMGILKEVSFPVPASCLPQHVRLIKRAAIQAGILEPFIVSEPQCALADYLEKNSALSSNQDLRTPSTLLLVDSGDATLDAIMCSVRANGNATGEGSDDGESRRFILNEETAGSTAFSGGSSVNRAFVDWVSVEFTEEFENMVNDGHYDSRDAIEAAAERAFEKAKKDFDGGAQFTSGLRVRLARFPPRPTNNQQGEYLRIPIDVVRGFFEGQLSALRCILEEQMQRFERRNGELRRVASLDWIVLVGGSNQSRFIQQQIRELVLNLFPKAAFRPGIILPDSHEHTSTSQGGLLLLQDNDFIGERAVRRAYCFKRNEQTSCTRSSAFQTVDLDPEGRFRCFRDGAIWLIKLYDRVAFRHQVHNSRGWRLLPIVPSIGDAFDHQTQEYIIQETFHYSDKDSEDFVDVYKPINEIFEAGSLEFRLPRSACFDLPIWEGDAKFCRLEYEVHVEIVGQSLSYFLVVPARGTLPQQIKKGELSWDADGGFACV